MLWALAVIGLVYLLDAVIIINYDPFNLFLNW